MRLLKNWAIATLMLTFLVILAGSIVRTTHSGMGCPDWPRCFGKWIPPTDASQLPPDFEKYLQKQDIDHSFNAFHTWIEYINRLFGVLLGVFAIIQLWLAYRRRKELPRHVLNLAKAFLAAIIITGLFGALVVKFNLAHLSVSIHLLLAIALTQIELAFIIFLVRKNSSIQISSNLKKLLILLFLIVFMQSVLGTGVRIYVDDISASLDYTQREKWLAGLPLIFLIHRSFSWLVFIFIGWCTWKCRNIAALKTPMMLLFGIVICSVITGVVMNYMDMPATAQPLHLLLASLAITQSVAILFLTTEKK